MHPAKGHQTKSDRAKIKKWCKLASSVKTKGHETNGRKEGLYT
jgi:hypothetical protein